MKIKYDLYGNDPSALCDFWEDISGGYIKPKEVLLDVDEIKKVEDAVALLHELKDAMEDAGLLEEM